MVAGLLAPVGLYVLATRRGVFSDADDVGSWLRSARWRPVLFAAGIAVAYVALQSPIDKGGDEFLFCLHMLQHVLLMMVAPPLLLLGICGAQPLAAARFPRLRRAWTAVTRPWPGVVVFTAVMLVWHIPSLYDATLTTEPIHIVEHLTFIAAGMVFWWPVVDPLRGPGTVPVGPFQKISVLVVSGIPPTALGLIFSIGTRTFYDFYARAPRLWGISIRTDQQIAGVIMFGLGNLIYFFAVSIIFVRLLADAGEENGEAEDPAPPPSGTGRSEPGRRILSMHAEGAGKGFGRQEPPRRPGLLIWVP